MNHKFFLSTNQLSGDSIAVALVNKCDGEHKIEASWADIGAKAGQAYKVSACVTLQSIRQTVCSCRTQVRDVLAHKDLPPATGSVSAVVGQHDVSVLRLEPVKN